MCLRGDVKSFETSSNLFETTSIVMASQILYVVEVMLDHGSFATVKLHNWLRKCDSGKQNIAGRRPSSCHLSDEEVHRSEMRKYGKKGVSLSKSQPAEF